MLTESISLGGHTMPGFGLGETTARTAMTATGEPVHVSCEGISAGAAFAIATGSTLVGGLLVWVATRFIDGHKQPEYRYA